MIIFIYDLDNTLHKPLKKNIIINNSHYYNSFKKKRFLKYLIKNKKYTQYIFTNGNSSHSRLLLQKLGIKELFPQKNILSADKFNYRYKPYKESYEQALTYFNINKNDDVYFFEDKIENLKEAKKFNWNTILIGNYNNIIDDNNYNDINNDNDNNDNNNNNNNNNDNKLNYIDWKFKNIEHALLYFKFIYNFNK